MEGVLGVAGVGVAAVFPSASDAGVAVTLVEPFFAGFFYAVSL